MTVGRKWVYWHRVIHVEEWAKEDIKLGSLLGLNSKDTGCMKMVWDEQRQTYDLKMYCKLMFLGRLLRTALPEEVANTFGGVIIPIEPNLACEEIKERRGDNAYCKIGSNQYKKLLCDANFQNGRCPKGLKPLAMVVDEVKHE